MESYLTSEDIKKMSKMTADEILMFMKENYPISAEEQATLNTQVNQLTYYKIHDLNLVGKLDQGTPYVYRDNVWVLDDNNLIMDRLMGYDESEPIGSPYAMGNTDMLERIKPISEDEALKLI